MNRSFFVCFGCFAVTSAIPAPSFAQTPPGPVIAQTSNLYPERFTPRGVDLGIGTRPQNLTPLGVNFQDCIDDQQLQFSVALSGFEGQDIQIWAGRNADCTQDANRGIGAVPACWQLNGGLAAVQQLTTSTYQFVVRVQDIVGPQNDPPNPPGYRVQTRAACLTQPTYAAESFTVYFIPVANGAYATGTAYSYQLPVDLLGPPPPSGLSSDAEDARLLLRWTPDVDPETTGYDVYVDPPPGQTVASLAPPLSDAAPDAATGPCNDPNLSSGLGDAGAAVGGISTVSPQYLVGVGTDGLTVPNRSTESYTLAGLTKGVAYTYAVSAVDDFGNIGPASRQGCDTPLANDAPSNGGCAVAPLGIAPVPWLTGTGLGVTALALSRRRRAASQLTSRTQPAAARPSR